MPDDLSAAPSREVIAASDEAAGAIGSPSEPAHGLVAVLDALGAAVYSREEADEFLKARGEIIELLVHRATDVLKVRKEDLKIFIFNDSVVLTYVRERLTVDDVNSFCGLLRSFEVSFLTKRILFRGALSYGELYRVDARNNTVMGPAVSDAAAWYGNADWLGIHVTPRTSILINSGLLDTPMALNHVLVDYDVPMTTGGTVRLKAVNWPKGLLLKYGRNGRRAKEALLQILGSVRSLPRGAESKYAHAIEFFEHCERETFVQSPASAPEVAVRTTDSAT